MQRFDKSCIKWLFNRWLTSSESSKHWLQATFGESPHAPLVLTISKNFALTLFSLFSSFEERVVDYPLTPSTSSNAPTYHPSHHPPLQQQHQFHLRHQEEHLLQSQQQHHHHPGVPPIGVLKGGPLNIGGRLTRWVTKMCKHFFSWGVQCSDDSRRLGKKPPFGVFSKVIPGQAPVYLVPQNARIP